MKFTFYIVHNGKRISYEFETFNDLFDFLEWSPLSKSTQLRKFFCEKILECDTLSKSDKLLLVNDLADKTNGIQLIKILPSVDAFADYCKHVDSIRRMFFQYLVSKAETSECVEFPGTDSMIHFL